MLCPQCQIPIEEGKCPQCGTSYKTARRSIKIATRTNTVQTPIKFDVSGPVTDATHPRTTDWRTELRRRLEEHSARGKLTDSDRRATETTSAEGEPHPASATAAKNHLFQYKLRQTGVKDSSSSKSPTGKRASVEVDPVLKKPLVRQKPVPPVSNHDSKLQKTFDLESVPTSDLEAAARETESPSQDKEQQEDFPSVSVPSFYEQDESVSVSKEILFSRFLAGMIDLAIPALTGFGFTALASLILHFELFTADSLLWAGFVSLAFFLFNSLFFLSTCGQTPGMYLTELQLIREGDDADAITPVLLRIVLFLPSVVSIAGLVPALFDPLARCVHDILSGTRVETIEHSESDSGNNR